MDLDVFAHFSMGVATSILASASLAGAIRYIPLKKADAIIAWTTLAAGLFYFYVLSGFHFEWILSHWYLVALENKQHYMIDAIWIVIGGFALWQRPSHYWSVILRSIAMGLIAFVLFFHVHDFSHAWWLEPYHRAISASLCVGIALYAIELRSGKEWAAVGASLALGAVGIMLMLYQAPGTAISCAPMLMDGLWMLMC